MAEEIITREELVDAKVDAKDLGECVNGNETGIVTPRYGEAYSTLPMAIQIIQESGADAAAKLENAGGYISVPTLAMLNAIMPAYNYQLARVEATGDEYRWEPTATPTPKWEATGRNYLSEAKADATAKANAAETNAKSYTDTENYKFGFLKDKIPDPMSSLFYQFAVINAVKQILFGAGDKGVDAGCLSIRSLESGGFFDKNMNAPILINDDGTVNIPFFRSIATSDLKVDLEQLKSKSGNVPFNPASAIYRSFNHIIINGQSLSTGDGTKYGGVTLSTSQPYNNLMVKSGVLSQYADRPFDVSQFIPLVEAEYTPENSTETPTSSVCNGLSARLVKHGYPTASTVFIGSNHGKGARTVKMLSEFERGGEGWFEKMVTQAKAIHDRVIAMGGEYNLQASVFWQGEYDQWGNGLSDNYKNMMAYAEQVAHLFDLFNQIMTAYAGKPIKPFIVLSQTSSHAKYQKTNPWVALAELYLAQNRDDYLLSHPDYCLGRIALDNLHLTPIDTWIGGQYAARAIEKSITVKKWMPLHCKSATWVGNTVTLDMHVPSGQLVFDNYFGELIPNYGFEIWEDGAYVNIISTVEIVGTSQVKITCSREPSLTAEVTYAFWRSGKPVAAGKAGGARGNLRDTNGLIDVVTAPDSTTYALHNACVTFKVGR
ncbi:hypothetical protein IEC338SC_3040 [Acinetobacter pittii]|uniref:Sialate O-acetylesterase domain-containing protein n=1 Tax=Acinetobacter pittii TaxID=48296 RepID=A0AB33BAB3_ACIPI|nr:hypothetical protein [Acinetobacter pittii]AMX20155.1 hypothetical protein IEC338SC_3040 [Acinetobacter pittii]